MKLCASDRRLCRLFVALVLGRWDEARRLRAEAPAGEPDRRWREALLQVHVFAGFPRGLEAFLAMESVGGLGEPEPGEERERLDAAEDLARIEGERAAGRAMFDAVYGDHAPRVRALLARQHADFAAWLEGHAYGRVLARDGLAPDRRELLAVVALAGLGQERQLASHARGAVRLGAEPAEVREAVEAVADLLRPERLAMARRVVERFARQL